MHVASELAPPTLIAAGSVLTAHPTLVALHGNQLVEYEWAGGAHAWSPLHIIGEFPANTSVRSLDIVGKRLFIFHESGTIENRSMDDHSPQVVQLGGDNKEARVQIVGGCGQPDASNRSIINQVLVLTVDAHRSSTRNFCSNDVCLRTHAAPKLLRAGYGI